MADWSSFHHAIDVSYYQGRIDWGAVKATGVHCAWIKVGGADAGYYTDSMAATNLANASRAGVPVGTYYFVHPVDGPASARFQAQDAVRRGLGQGDCLPMLDMETNPVAMSPPQLDQWALAFVDEVAGLTGRTSLIYTGAYFGLGFNNPATGRAWTPELGRYPLWIANYAANTPGYRPTVNGPPIPPAWSKWSIWQHNAVTAVPGIVGDVDQNIVDPAFFDAQPDRVLDHPKEELLMKRFMVAGQAAQWRLIDDGNGVLRRQGIPTERRANLLARSGLVDDEIITLTDALDIADFESVPVTNEQGSDVGELRLTANIIAEIRHATETVLAGVGDEHIHVTGDGVEPAALAERVAEELSARLANHPKTAA